MGLELISAMGDTPPTSMHHDKTYSTRFPEDYGDCALESSDGVIFHFPRCLLRHSSIFFKNKLDVHPSSPEPIQHIVLEESSEILELLLIHMDPTMKTERVTEDILEPLLSVSLRYGVSHIKRGLMEGVLTGRVDPRTGEEISALIYSNPFSILRLAHRYDLADMGRQALREILRWSEDDLGEEIETLPKEFRIYIRRVRKERTAEYQQRLGRLLKMRSAPRSQCSNCSKSRIELFVSLERVAHERPCWSAFSEVVETEGYWSCKECRNESSLGCPDNWEKERTEVEQVLPEWPEPDV